MSSGRFPNNCMNCGYSWSPRGHDLAAKCPRCRGANIKIDYTQAYLGMAVMVAFGLFLLYSNLTKKPPAESPYRPEVAGAALSHLPPLDLGAAPDLSAVAHRKRRSSPVLRRIAVEGSLPTAIKRAVGASSVSIDDAWMFKAGRSYQGKMLNIQIKRGDPDRVAQFVKASYATEAHQASIDELRVEAEGQSVTLGF